MTAPSTSGVNRRVAELLRQYAALLEQQQASSFRVNAYRRASETVDSLEVAAHDGSLESLPGVGIRRAAGIRAALAAMLRRTRPPQRATPAAPNVEILLDVDREYRLGKRVVRGREAECRDVYRRADAPGPDSATTE